MAISRKLDDGRLVILEGRGWREATPEEYQASEVSGPEAFGLGIKATLGGLGQLNAWAHRGFEGSPDLSMMEPAAAASQFRPGVTGAGMGAPLALLGGAGYAGRMAGRVQQSISRQAAARSARQTAQEAATAPPQAGLGPVSNVDEYGLPVSQVGAGEASGPKGLLDTMTEAFNQTVPLSDQQRAAAQAVTMGQVRFQPLPGQFGGNRLMNSGVKSNPNWLAEFEPELVANQREGARLIKQGMGLPEGTPLTDEIWDAAEASIGGKFDTVRDTVTQPVRISPEATEVLTPALSAWQRRASAGKADEAAEQGLTLDAEEAFEVLSRINATVKDLAIKGEMVAADDLRRAGDEVLEGIEGQITPANMALWQEAKAQWRVKLAVQANNVIGKGGDINWPSLANSLQRAYRKQYRGYGPRKNLPPAAQELIDFAKVASSFPDAVGNSGTAERLASMEALRNPARYAKDRAVGKMIRFLADQTPPPMVQQ